MGGSALKNCTTRRYMADEYFQIEAEVCSMLRNIDNFGYTRRVIPVKAYGAKDSFGDMDVILESNGLDESFEKTLTELFNPKEMVKNGKVWSLEYKEFQIDIILTPTSEMMFAETYYAFNDLGNLMGRIAHKFGLKYGHNGLWYMLRDDTYLIDEICVSMDVRDVFAFLDYDYDVWRNGFDTLEDVFNFVTTSKYFNPDIYLFDQMNHRSRVRDAKRKTYNAFLTWCEEKRKTDWKDRTFFKYEKPKSDYIMFISESFPNFKKDVYDAYAKMLVRREVQSKFNGEIVKALTGFQNKELGALMKRIKENFSSKDELDLFMLSSSKETIESFIMSHF